MITNDKDIKFEAFLSENFICPICGHKFSTANKNGEYHCNYCGSIYKWTERVAGEYTICQIPAESYFDMAKQISELQEELKDLEEANKSLRSKVEQRNIQVADLKNKLFKEMGKVIRLSERIDEMRTVNDNYLKEICELKQQLIDKITKRSQ